MRLSRLSTLFTMDDNFDQAFQQAAVFQKMWMDAFTQMSDVWSRFSPGNPPPDTIRDMRAGMLKVLTEAWDQFMRTPQFMEYMKTSMDGFLSMRKMAADAMTRKHHEMQSTAREDIDGVLLAIRHMERRLLDRMEEIETAVSAVGQRMDTMEVAAAEPAGVKSAPAAAPAPEEAPRKNARRSRNRSHHRKP